MSREDSAGCKRYRPRRREPPNICRDDLPNDRMRRRGHRLTLDDLTGFDHMTVCTRRAMRRDLASYLTPLCCLVLGLLEVRPYPLVPAEQLKPLQLLLRTGGCGTRARRSINVRRSIRRRAASLRRHAASIWRRTAAVRPGCAGPVGAARAV
eukprot:1194559-Prorocentrum_minimum.AAC.2